VTIEKGREWGHRGQRPQSVHVVHSDADVVRAWTQDPNTTFAVVAGDLHMALGQPKWKDDQTECQFLSVDVFHVTVTPQQDHQYSKQNNAGKETIETFALSSVRIGSWFTRGRFITVSNCGFVGRYNIAPRAHPNDGEMDVVTVYSDMDWRQRIQARSRARLGQHIPHPQISMERGLSHSWHKEHKRERLFIDGEEMRNWGSVEVTVIPDACAVVV
jgi:hypothetical protein